MLPDGIVARGGRLRKSHVRGYDANMARPQPIDDVSKGEGVLRLGQFLQMAGLVDSGGEAKEVIREGHVTVNDEVDERRGRQLAVGDVVAFGGRRARVAD